MGMIKRLQRQIRSRLREIWNSEQNLYYVNSIKKIDNDIVVVIELMNTK